MCATRSPTITYPAGTVTACTSTSGAPRVAASRAAHSAARIAFSDPSTPTTIRSEVSACLFSVMAYSDPQLLSTKITRSGRAAQGLWSRHSRVSGQPRAEGGISASTRVPEAAGGLGALAWTALRVLLGARHFDRPRRNRPIQRSASDAQGEVAFFLLREVQAQDRVQSVEAGPEVFDLFGTQFVLLFGEGQVGGDATGQPVDLGVGPAHCLGCFRTAEVRGQSRVELVFLGVFVREDLFGQQPVDLAHRIERLRSVCCSQRFRGIAHGVDGVGEVLVFRGEPAHEFFGGWGGRAWRGRAGRQGPE